MIIDITFIPQRPNAITIFWSLGSVVVLVCLSVVPEISKAGDSWRTFYIIWTVPSGIAFLLAFLFFPETYFLRPAIAFDGYILVQSATEKIKLYKDWDEVPGGKALPDIPSSSSWSAALRRLQIFSSINGGWKAMAACYPQILMCLLNPLILWVALLNAVVFGGMMSIGITYATVLSAAPYNLPMNIIALVNLAAAVGALLAWPASGLLINRISRRLAIRNAGVRDAEHYLPAFILPILTGAASVILYGITAQNHFHYIFIYISYALNTFASIGLGIANTLWVTEAFPRWAAPALVIVGGGSYVTSFGMSFAVLPWVGGEGYLRENVEIGVLILVIGCLGIPVAKWGKPLRLWIHGRWGMGSESGALRPQ
jgi:MFS family permease